MLCWENPYGKPSFLPQGCGFPVDFPFNQFKDIQSDSQKQKLFVSADQILGVLVVTRFQILEWNQHMFQVFEAFLRPP